MIAPDAPVGLRRRVVSSFLVVMLALMAAGGLPRFAGVLGTVQDTVLDWVDPVVMPLGLWQERWELYGPEPDRRNVGLSGGVRFADGAQIEWRSPNWRALDWTEKLRWFRHAEYVDAVRRNRNSATWEPLARYLVRDAAVTKRHPGVAAARPVEVELWRHWVEIPEPAEPLRPWADPLPLEHTQSIYREQFE